jgi:hypothetical protein
MKMRQPMRKHGFNLIWVYRAWTAALLVGSLALGAGLLIESTEQFQPSLLANPEFPPLEDFDGDGIPNIAENEFHRVDPMEEDVDRDGYQDGFELATGSDPFNCYSTPAAASGTRILVAPDGNDVYVVFLMASDSCFMNIEDEKILFALHNKKGPLAFVSIDVTAALLKRVNKLASQDQRVRSWTMKFSRKEIGLWSLGFGMTDLGKTYCDGVFIHLRKNNLIYTVRFNEEEMQVTSVEPTESGVESESGSGNPGIGFKECEQTSVIFQNNPALRFIAREVCEFREHYVCPPDCGTLTGQVVINLGQVWLY